MITEDGSENKSIVKTLIDGQHPPTIEHLIAQLDIEYPDPMIEALNKQIKYRFLYHHQIANHEALRRHLQQAVDDYNNRPQAVLIGLTPI